MFNLGALHEAVAAEIPGHECIVSPTVRRSWAEVTDRTRRLASWLRSRGLGCHRERDGLAGWEAGQDLLALYLHNSPEYLEGMLGAYKARVAPFNVNYRYVAEELHQVLADAGASAVVYHSALAPTLAGVRDRLPRLTHLLQVPDASGHPLLRGATWYDDALRAVDAEPPGVLPPDDLYVLYTGGTTGAPRGVLWRQGDICAGAFPPRGPHRAPATTLEEALAGVRRTAGRQRALALPPFMHGAAHWFAFTTLHAGGTVVLPEAAERFDPEAAWRAVARERVTGFQVVGDAFARPLLDALDRLTSGGARPEVGSLRVVVNGGAPLSPATKRALLARLPGVRIADVMGSSESGQQGVRTDTDPGSVASGSFAPSDGAVVLEESLTRVLGPGERAIGWLATAGRVPLGYLGDPDKTRRTFPVVEGVRYAVAGDRARVADDGTIEVLGRDAATINTGGEKVFAEEVEQALKSHPDVADALVVGRPSERWGSEVAAVVALRPGASPSDEELLGAAGRDLARYKLPKVLVRRGRVERSPSGKPDYRWARAQLSGTNERSAPS